MSKGRRDRGEKDEDRKIVFFNDLSLLFSVFVCEVNLNGKVT